MNPGDWQRIKLLLGQTLEIAREDRKEWLDAHCVPDLRPEVERLLAEHDAAGGFLSFGSDSPSPAPVQPRLVFTPGDIAAGRYRIVARLGQGGMGQVYEAEDLHLGNRIALKIVHPHGEDPAAARQMLRAEVQAARKVTHKNVCRIHDFGEHAREGAEPVCFLTMELLEGETLGSRLRRGPPLAPEEALIFIRQIAAALDTAHDAGIVHRDLKPQNVMLVPAAGGTNAVVMDFGLALASSSSPTSDEGAVRIAGTPAWMAPEQLAGAPPHPAVDVFAFGLLITRMIGAQPGDLSAAPPAWRPVLTRCFDREPELRPRSAGEIARALSPRFRRSLWPVAAAATVVAAAAGVLLWERFLPSRPPSLERLSGEGLIEISFVTSDGRYLVGTQQNGALAFKEVATGKLRPIPVAQGAHAHSGRVSPDGRSIAYCWIAKQRPHELRIAPIDGGSPRTVWSYQGAKLCNLKDWSPSGKELLLQYQDERDIYRWAVVPAAGGAPEEVRPSVSARGGAVFLTDRTIAFEVLASGSGAPNWDIDLLDRDSGRTSPLVHHPASEGVLAISPDRRTLLFESSRLEGNSIWRLPLAHGVPGEPELVRTGVGMITAIGLDRESTFFYEVSSSREEIMLAEFDPVNLRLAGEPRLLPRRVAHPMQFPSWSMDGKTLACLLLPSTGEPLLGFYSIETRRWREALVDLGSMSRPQWWTANSLIAQGVAPDGRLGHHRIDPVTGAAELVADRDDIGTGMEGAWSPDGRWMFNRFYDEDRGLFRWDIGRRRRTMLYVPPPGESLVQELLTLSPDGKTLTFQLIDRKTNDRHLMLIPAAGGSARRLRTVKAPDMFRFHGFTWLPDSRRLLVAIGQGYGKAARTNLEVISVADGSQTPVPGLPPMQARHFRLNRDARWLAFVRLTGERRTELWALRNSLSPAR